jgi:hypothetical protein
MEKYIKIALLSLGFGIASIGAMADDDNDNDLAVNVNNDVNLEDGASNSLIYYTGYNSMLCQLYPMFCAPTVVADDYIGIGGYGYPYLGRGDRYYGRRHHGRHHHRGDGIRGRGHGRGHRGHR